MNWKLLKSIIARMGTLVGIVVCALLILFVVLIVILSLPISQGAIAKQIPQYPGASKWEIDVSNRAQTFSNPGRATICFTSIDSLEEIFSFYQQEFQRFGWRTEIREAGGSPHLFFYPKEGDKGSITGDIPSRPDCDYEISIYEDKY